MPKNRMTALDVRACVNELKKSILGAKVSNVYDVNNKTYIIKVVKSGVQFNLLLESGIRLHTTRFLREKSRFPNGFALKLRKHIRNRRVEAVRQIGFDRVVDLVFGNGENTYHVILELYSGGNIILTDYKFEIQSLLRVYSLPDGTEVNVKKRYSVLPKQHSPFELIATMSVSSLDDMKEFFQSHWSDLKTKEKQIRSILLTNPAFSLLGSGFVNNVCCALQIAPTSLIELEGCLATEESRLRLLEEVKRETGLINDAINASEGFILKSVLPNTSEEIFSDYSPYELHANTNEICQKYDSFLQCMDSYFQNEENMKLVIKMQKSKEAIEKKVNTISTKQDLRVKAIEEEIAVVEERIGTLFRHPDVVNTAIIIINQYLSQGMQWGVLEEQIKQFKSRPYNVFHHIKSLDLDHNRIKLEFEREGDAEEEESSEEEEESTVQSDQINVDIELSCNCNNNIVLLYKQKKELEDKLEKTKAAAEQAVKEASQQKEKELVLVEKTQQTELMKKRTKKWFEKFDWFVTSENYIVIGGKSGEQNELLVRKYLRKGDIFMHADVHGAASVIIRNYQTIQAATAAISDLAIQQAAVFSLCHSVSWDNNLLNKVYWVYDYQVSKTAQSGEYLPTGSFMIRGKKNYVSPFRLEMGIGLLFEVDEEYVKKHMMERKRKDLDEKEWEDVVYKGEIKTNNEMKERESDFEQEEEEEEYSIEVMNSVVTSSKKAKPVIKTKEKKSALPKKEDSSKKSLKGTTKKSRAAAEEREYLEELVEKGEEKKKKEMSRGERRKQKIIKKKYSQNEVDEEDSELLSVLYGRKDVNSLLKEKEEKKEEKKEIPLQSALMAELVDTNLLSLLAEPETKAETTPEEEKVFCFTCGEEDHTQESCPESWRVIEHITNEPTEVVESKEREEDEEVEKKEENRDVGDFLLNWTHLPNAEDSILHVIPVCAPYMVLADYPYRTKLTVGSMKKGKMAKDMVEFWVKGKSDSMKKAIRQIPMEDITSVIMNNSKVVLPGSAKVKK